ncbi:Protein PCF11 [Spathaspora sp. JA1]|nr:Protein PCF11 [Spathaspora sp. JA1]
MVENEKKFDGEYYKNLLNSLTINSRAVITELTGLAEQHIEHSMDITKMIEERIKKCVPKQKLFSFYLMDSIVKNIGNPYNIIFSQNLFKIFVETYSLVTDTPTRQSLINLFRTWISGKNSGGGEIFPAAILTKIEKFIIKATTIQGGAAGSGIPSQTVITDGIPLTPDMLLKEGRSLLHYVIVLNKALDRILEDKNPYLDKKDDEDFKFIHAKEIRRNLLVSIINETMDSIYIDVQGNNDETKSFGEFSVQNNKFEDRAAKYQVDLKAVRKELDEHSFQQEQFLKKFNDKINQLIIKQKQNQEKLQAKEKVLKYLEENKVEIDYKNPDIEFFSGLTRDIHKDRKFVTLINKWGKVPVYRREVVNENKHETDKPTQGKPENKAQENSLGFNFGSLDFNELSQNELEPSTLSGSGLGSSFLFGNDDKEEEDEDIDNSIFARIRPPTPPPPRSSEPTLAESPRKVSFNDYKSHKSTHGDSIPPPPPLPPTQDNLTRKSSLKKRSIGGDFNRVVKKVRFDI